MKKIWMKKPSGWAGELWRESLPIGNGLTGALLCGSVGGEYLWINRFDRWEGGEDCLIPDVSDALEMARVLIAEGRCEEANGMLASRLRESGYGSAIATPMAPVEIRLRFESEQPFRHYRRGIDLETGEAFVTFDQGETHIERRAFVSRSDDQTVFVVRSTGSMNLKIDKPEDDRFRMKVIPSGGVLEDKGNYLQIKGAPELLVLARFDAEPVTGSYEVLLEKHLPLYREAMGSAEMILDGGDHSNELLLDEAAEEEAPVELYEKLWRFGRYLFASGTADGGDPFPLYGLWGGQAKLMWSQNVANENVEMIYWHAPVGGYAHLLRPLIHYYCRKMDVFRAAARKLFGCRGIYVSTYTTPMNSVPAPNVPVIVNYIGCAGWLSRHFYDYYRYTGDDKLLKEEILPFMLEAAAFYEDYVLRDSDGKIAIIPSVSPENTPANFIPDDYQTHMAHPNPVVWNSTMDFAILRELLTNLLALSENFPQDPQRVEVWKAILRDMPDYMVNKDGAIREWMDERLDDFYFHRHLSHIYPMFPGEEITPESPLFDAFAKAVDLRELGALSGWALAHMSSIYARMARGNQALDCLNTLARGCLLNNLFTLHNDWRDMGVSLRLDVAPVQLDALMGTVNALQEMLLYAAPDRLAILPACPDAFDKGEIKDWRFPGGRISFAWNRAESRLTALITAERPVRMQVRFPDWSGIGSAEISMAAGETKQFAMC